MIARVVFRCSVLFTNIVIALFCWSHDYPIPIFTSMAIIVFAFLLMLDVATAAPPAKIELVSYHGREVAVDVLIDRWGLSILGLMIERGAADMSDAEIQRCIGDLSPAMIATARAMARDPKWCARFGKKETADPPVI